MLVKYVKNNRGNLIGVVVATDKHNIGWSLCNKRDRFNKDFGRYIAIGRAEMDSTVDIPHSIINEYIEMKNRALRYFKK